MPIQKLKDHVISQIAAGEVIERPASIVRELLDNSLDAGAKEISVELRFDATAESLTLSVSDNGSGIAKAELPLALERHATSKIGEVEDIFSCQTMGFRGEALASIGSISQLVLTSATKHGEGFLITCRGGVAGKIKNAVRPIGTTIEVSEIFYNLPVRQGFLKSLSAEKAEMKREIILRALAHEGVGFTMRSLKSGETTKEELRIPASLSLREKVHLLFGSRIEKELIEIVSDSKENIKITGFVTSPHYHGKSRREQFFFYKKRAVSNLTLATALGQAYLNLLPGRTYPGCVLLIEAADHDVDVNVHPQKKDIRFRDQDLMFRALYHKVKDTLLRRLKEEGKIVPQFSSSTSLESPTLYPTNLPKQTSLFSLQEDRVANESLVYKLKTPGDFPDSSLPFAQQKVRGESVPNFYVLGQIGKLFIVYAVGNDLYLADGHALHERMNFDKLSARLDERELDYQELLTPLVFDIGAVDSEKVLAMAKTFEGLGLFFEDFGGGKIKLDRVPDYLGRGHSQKIISGLLSEVLEVPLKNRSELREKALSTMACRMSIMSGDALTRELMEDLISQLYEKDYVHLCPHGRPFVKKISFAEMCVFFGREAKVENETV